MSCKEPSGCFHACACVKEAEREGEREQEEVEAKVAGGADRNARSTDRGGEKGWGVLKDLGEEGEEKRGGWVEVGCRAEQKC